MTIETTDNRVERVCNGVTASYPFPYKVLLGADLKVYLVETATGVSDLQVLDTDYTLTGVGEDEGVSIVPDDPAEFPTGYTLVAFNDPKITQPVDLTQNDSLPVQAFIEDPLDRLTIIAQRLSDRIDRSVSLPDDDLASTLTVPPFAERVSQPAGWDANGNFAAIVGGISEEIPVSSFVEPILLAADAETFRAAIGALSEAEIQDLIDTSVEDALSAVGGFPTGTAMLFNQTSAPTGWTKDTTHNNKALRVVSGTVGSGGSVDFTTAFASQTPAGTIAINAVTLSTANLPASPLSVPAVTGLASGSDTGALRVADGTAASPLATGNLGSGTAFTPTGVFTGSAINLAVKYADVIIATKDA